MTKCTQEITEKLNIRLKSPIFIEGYKIVPTCYACPEQYDVYAQDIQVAYLRLRHGLFKVVVPDVGGNIIHSSNPKGDGRFYDDERLLHLKEAILKIQEWQLNFEPSVLYQTGKF